MNERYTQSRTLLQRAERSLAGGVSSNVRRGDKPFPLYFDSGTGSRLFDADGNEYIDYVLGRGPLILGHTHPEVIEATCRQLWKGQVYAAQHQGEIELAERIVSAVPSAQRVRFGISGSEAVHGALRLARAFTGRELIVKFEGHYHGWLDNILYSLSPAEDVTPSGLPESRGQFCAEDSRIAVLPWNDIDRLRGFMQEHGKDVAAIITEPIMCNTAVIEPESGYLEALRAITSDYGALLIFDEVITGFRVSLSGAQGHYGIQPDLSIFGKAVANGMPMSVIAGREDVFELIATGKVGHGGTLQQSAACDRRGCGDSGCPATGSRRRLPAHQRDRNGSDGRNSREGGFAGSAGGCPGASVSVLRRLPFEREGPMCTRVTDYQSSLAIDNDLYSRFVSAMADRGVRIIPRGNWFLSAAHSMDDVAQTLEAVEGALTEAVVPQLAASVPRA